MIDKNLRLYLPFDDPDGSKAYDYSVYRNDATLSDGARFSKDARVGKSLDVACGECVTAQAIPFNGNFTITAYITTKGGRVGWLLNLPGVVEPLEQWLDLVPGQWYFMAFVREGGTFKVYLDAERVFAGTFAGTPVGFSISTDELLTTAAKLDELRVYDVAKSEKEVLMLQADNDVEYYIDGVNFKDYGVHVSASSGLVGRLAQKEGLTVEYDNYHGIVRDRKRKRFKERTITLDCFIEGVGRSVFVERVNSFFAAFDGEHTRRLTVEYDGNTKPLVYEVDLMDETDVDKKWGHYNDELMVGTFKLKLVEDEPVKRVLRHVSATSGSKATITLTSYKLVSIYWGDGSHTFNAGGNNATFEHVYSQPGEYDIVVAGVIEDIEQFDTNAIVVWELLK